MDKAGAERAARHGAIAAFVSAAMTLAVVSLAIISDSQGALKLWNDPLNLVDVVLVTTCAVGLLRRSRAAALALLVYFVIARIAIVVETGKPSGIGVTLIFAYFFARAVHGTFVYQRIRRAEDPDVKSVPRWVYFVGIPIGVLSLALVSVGLLVTGGYLPDTKVLTGDQMPRAHVDELRTAGIIGERETLRYFYSNGLLSVLEDGNALTDSRVISYETLDERLVVYRARYDEIASFRVVSRGDFSNPTIVEVRMTGGDGFNLYLSPEDGGDERFVTALRERVGAAR